MSPARKRTMLWGSLVLTLAATGWVASNDDTGKPPERTAGERRNAPAVRSAERRAAEVKSEPVAELRLEALARPEFSGEPGDLFPSRTWQAPAPASSAPPAPPRPPPIPFAYFGQLTEDGKAVVFLSRGNTNFAVRQGDTLESTYRIDEIRRDLMVLTYLPLQQQQTLAIGSTK